MIDGRRIAILSDAGVSHVSKSQSSVALKKSRLIASIDFQRKSKQ